MFGEDHWEAMDNIVKHESGYNLFSINHSSGACGLFQALPCSKLPCQLSDVDCQLNWGLSYVKNRYGTPQNAWEFWQKQEPHWY